MSSNLGGVHLRTAVKRYPHTAKLITGEINDPQVQLDWIEIEPIHRAFAPMARTQAYDVSEMAIVTYLQAKAYDKPLILVPTVVAARLQQKAIVYNRKRGPMRLSDLAGARVGVRAYAQTTGMWVRAILAGTYGIPTDSMKWMTFEHGHLAEYEDPPFATRMPPGSDMLEMLREGDLDAAIFGNDLPGDEGIEPLIPNPAEADRIWYETHRFVPINHVIVMNRAVAEHSPGTVAAVYNLFKRGKTSTGAAVGDTAASDTAKALPDGIDAMRRPLEMILELCAEQQLLPRPLTVDEIFADCTRYLGDEAR